MGFSDAVQWWEEEQLRALVLTSLILQYILLAAATLRKYRNWPGQKFITWLLYLASDAVAVYALATMFNRHRKQEWISTHRKDASLEALWAPILLLHLGGLDAITAYNIEDNELWSRHLLTAVSQIIVAIYVIRKSWSGGDRLLQAATIYILVPGVLKCLEKPLALRKASINSIQGDDGKTDKDKRSSRRRRERRAHRQSSGSENNPARESQDGLEDAPLARSLDEYVQTARNLVLHPVPDAEEPSDGGAEANEASDNKSNTKTPLDLRGESEIFGAMPYRLFVDLAYTYTNRLENIRSMVQKKGEAHRLVRCSLSKAFDRLYTKNEVLAGLFHGERPGSRKGQILRFLIIELTFVAVVFFHTSNRESYNATDVKITYTLICCTASLEYISLGIIFGVIRPQGVPERSETSPPQPVRKRADAEHPWPDQVAQYNLIGYLARNKKYQGLRSWLPLVAQDYIDQLWCMKSSCKSSNITQLIYDHVMYGWQNCIKDTVSYRKFNDNRGQTTLKREECEGTSLEPSLQRPFDESVLLWHLATDFCFHLMPPCHQVAANRCREMSNYMVYLLFVNPEMLMTGARRSLFRAAYKELKELLQDEGELARQNRVLDENEITAKVIAKVRAGAQGEGLVHNAWTVAEELMGLGREKMWKVIQGVWVEMLCFSAGRCRGYLHAKSLGMGGEYLSYVWLLLWYMGMETLGERIQRNDPQAQGEVGATVSASAPLVMATGDDNA